MRNIDHNDIRKELVRLSKMARSLRMKELAYFIDVAGEVASEMPPPKAERAKEPRHALTLSKPPRTAGRRPLIAFGSRLAA